MLWALEQNDPEDLLHKDDPAALTDMLALIVRNDKEFKPQLETYKKAKRFHLDSEIEERKKCELFIAELEQRLSTEDPSIEGNATEGTKTGFFIGNKPSLLDYALLPFVRQFSRVNKVWFKQAPYPFIQAWLERHLQSRLYSKAMAKYPLWLDEHEECIFGKD
jgi:glutathione S-transferase